MSAGGEAIETRDGWFDAQFGRPVTVDGDELQRRAQSTRPATSDKRPCLEVMRHMATTRSGLRLAKAFMAFFVAYALCLAPLVRTRLGRYSHVMVVSCIINHPARTVGAQIDGAVLTTLGTAGGLAWGAFGLWLSTSTAPASIGYGGILALFLCVCVGSLAALRSYFIRLYQFVICAGFAIVYTCLAEDSGQEVRWAKLRDYGIPWLLGQAICLVICILWFPDAGTRGVAVALNDAFNTLQDGLQQPRKHQSLETRSKLAKTFIDLSQAYRDFAIDLTVSVFEPREILTLRNVLQGLVRAMLSMKPETAIYGPQTTSAGQEESPKPPSTLGALVYTTVLATPGLSEIKPEPLLGPIHAKEKAIRVVRYRLEEPTKALTRSMAQCLGCCHAVLMDMSGYRRHLGPDGNTPSDVAGSLVDLRRAMMNFDHSESALLDGDELTAKYVPEVVKIFAFCRPIRQTATALETAMVAVNRMEQRKRRPAVHLPSYPWRKSLNRTGPQVRHDRGGITAGSYFRSFFDIRRLILQIRTSEHSALADEPDLFAADSHAAEPWPGPAKEEKQKDTSQHHDVRAFLGVGGSQVRHKIWEVAHRLQGFEMRFALKNAIVVSLLAVPAWLPDSRDWWNRYESWWAVAMAWLMMHPRVGGNVQDLLTRVSMAVIGALWAGFAYAAAPGNAYVMAVFATVYMIPMLHRFTQSKHPRSGLVACISFTVTSLDLVTDQGQTHVVVVAGTAGAAFVVGVVASVTINWLIWPFVARHELRKALSDMTFFLSIGYRNIIAKYVYYDQKHGPPRDQDVRKSEIIEGRLREGFVRVRELMGMTKHEIRLRAPFDDAPYRLLADACERFFEYLVAVRQSAMSFHPKYAGDDPNDEAVARLLHHRRDAVAAVLTNLYVLACALRSGATVPKYLPSATASRATLLDKMAEVEAEYEDEDDNGDQSEPVPQMAERRKWVQVYTYSCDESLTGCVAQLEELERYTKLIVGEQTFDEAFERGSPDEDE